MSVPLLPFFGVTYQLNILGVPPFGVITVDNTIGPPGQPGPGHGLFCQWDIRKAWGNSPDTGTVTVANLDIPFRKALAVRMAVPGPPLQVQLLVGWGGFPEQLIVADVLRAQPEVKDRTDVFTHFELGDGAVALRDTPPAGGTEVGLGISAIVLKLVTIDLGYVASPSAIAVVAKEAAKVPIPLLNGQVYDAPAEQQLNELLESIGLTWGHSNGFWVVYRLGVRQDILPAILTPNHGLLNWVEQDDGAIMFNALGQSRLEPGAQITIKDEKDIILGGGPLRIENIQFTGSNETTYTMSGVAKKLEIAA